MRLAEGHLRPRGGWTGGTARRDDQRGRIAAAARQLGHQGGMGGHAGRRADGCLAAPGGGRGWGPGRQAGCAA
eukprot:6983762-Alexandrium_andersonii.AAC.1